MIEITAGNAERRVAELRFHFGQRRSLADELDCVRMPQTVEVGPLADARAPRQALDHCPAVSGVQGLLSFRKGFAHLAIATGLSVVPVVLHGAHERLPDRSFRLMPGALEVEVMEPIDTRSWKRETVDEHIEQVHEIVRRALRPAQRPFQPPRC